MRRFTSEPLDAVVELYRVPVGRTVRRADLSTVEVDRVRMEVFRVGADHGWFSISIVVPADKRFDVLSK